MKGVHQIIVLHTSGWRGRQTTKVTGMASSSIGLCQGSTIWFAPLTKYLLITCFIFTFSVILNAQRTSVFPAPMGFINDYENDFTPDQVKQLDFAVKDLLAKTMSVDSLNGIEVAIVTVTENMFGDEKEMSSYVTRLGDKWGVASKGQNKAIIIAYGKKIRKVSIITGQGLDNILPASQCHKIVDEKMAPEFRKGNYFEAILEAVKSIKEYIGLR